MPSRTPIDDERHFALWSMKRARPASAPKRVLVAHKDKSIGESLAVLLRLKGLQVIHSQDLKAVRRLVQSWKPHAVVMDTRLDSDSDYVFIRTLRAEADLNGRFLVAMSNVWPADPVETLKDAGFDAHCRRPCATWRIAELLEAYFTAPAKQR
jgi:DNA-binding response OmpR family regulator